MSLTDWLAALGLARELFGLAEDIIEAGRNPVATVQRMRRARVWAATQDAEIDESIEGKFPVEG